MGYQYHPDDLHIFRAVAATKAKGVPMTPEEILQGIQQRAAARAVLAAHEAEKAAQSAVPGWCPGCTPDNCQGCGVVGGQDLSRKTAPAAPASASEAPVAVPLTDELVGKLLRTHSALSKMTKKYGEIGSRDVDVARWNADLCEAIRAVGDVLADQPLEQLARIKLEGGQ